MDHRYGNCFIFTLVFGEVVPYRVGGCEATSADFCETAVAAVSRIVQDRQLQGPCTVVDKCPLGEKPASRPVSVSLRALVLHSSGLSLILLGYCFLRAVVFWLRPENKNSRRKGTWRGRVYKVPEHKGL